MTVSIELSCTGLPFMPFHQGSQTHRETLPHAGTFWNLQRAPLKKVTFAGKFRQTLGFPSWPAPRTQKDTNRIFFFHFQPSPAAADIPGGCCPSQGNGARQVAEGERVNTPRQIRKAKKEKRYQKPNPTNIKMLFWFTYIFLKSTQKIGCFFFFLFLFEALTTRCWKQNLQEGLHWNTMLGDLKNNRFILHSFPTISDRLSSKPFNCCQRANW